MKKGFPKFILTLFAICTAFALFGTGAFAELAVTKQPQNYAYPEGAVAVYQCDSDSENAAYTWYIIFDGKTTEINKGSFETDLWTHYSEGGFGTSSDGKSVFFEGVMKELEGAVLYCVISEGGEAVKTGEAFVSVAGEDGPMPPEISVPLTAKGKAGETFSLEASVTPFSGTTCKYIWYESGTGKLQDIKAVTDNDTADRLALDLKLGEGTYYYCIGVFAEKNGITAASYSSMIKVTVEGQDTPGPEKITPEPEETPTAKPSPTPEESPVTTPETETETEKPGPEETPIAEPTSAPEVTPAPSGTKEQGKNESGWYNAYTVVIVIAVALLVAGVAVFAIASGNKKKKGRKKKGKKKKR